MLQAGLNHACDRGGNGSQCRQTGWMEHLLRLASIKQPCMQYCSRTVDNVWLLTVQLRHKYALQGQPENVWLCQCQLNSDYEAVCPSTRTGKLSDLCHLLPFCDFHRMRHISIHKGLHFSTWTTAILSYYISECSELVFIYHLLNLVFSTANSSLPLLPNQLTHR